MTMFDDNVSVVMLKGEQGASIESIEKTDSVGRTDTYTVTLTNGNTQKFYVTNGEKGDKGDKGDDGISIPASGMFSMSVDDEGNLWAHYLEQGSAPNFEYNSSSGDLYFVIEE